MKSVSAQTSARYGLKKLLALACSLLITVGSAYVVSNTMAANIAQAATPTSSQQSTPATSSTNTKVAQAAPIVAPTDSRTSSYRPVCTIANYTAPVTPVAAQHPIGVTKLNDGATYYAASARSRATLTSEMHACALKQPSLKGYDAITSYNVAWSYAYTTSGDGRCAIVSPKVVMRVKQLLPALTDTSDDATKAQWATTSAKLYAHENEHVAINFAHADALYQELSSLSGSCDTIVSDADSLIKRHLSALSTENEQLDNTTRHGSL